MCGGGGGGAVVGGGEGQKDNGAEGCLASFEDRRPRVYFGLKQQHKGSL